MKRKEGDAIKTNKQRQTLVNVGHLVKVSYKEANKSCSRVQVITMETAK